MMVRSKQQQQQQRARNVGPAGQPMMPMPQSGYRRTEVWADWVDWPANTMLWGHDLVPAAMPTTEQPNRPFPSVASLDHKLIEAYVEVDVGLFDTNVYAAVLTAGLVRFGPGYPTAEPRTLSEYSGARRMDVTPDKNLTRWVFKPRENDTVDSVHVDHTLQIQLGLRETAKTVTGSNTAPALKRPTDLMRLRVGATYLVRDRQGLLL